MGAAALHETRERGKRHATSSQGGGGRRKKVLGRLQAIGNEVTALLTCDCGTPLEEHAPLAGASMSYQPPINIDALMNAAIQRVYDRKLQAGDIDADLWQANTNTLWQGVREGWGQVTGLSPAQIRLLELRRNVNVFAAFKNHANTVELTLAMFDANGQERSFSEFKKAALAISEKYNVNHLKAEWNLAQGSALSARNWQEMDTPGAMLQYRTVRDGRVREAHVILDGTTLPATHEFWNNYYPPNGWGCRCVVRKRSSTTEAVSPKGLPELKPAFANNVGKTSQIFTNQHPYIREVGDAKAEELRALAAASSLKWERKYMREQLKDAYNRSLSITIGDKVERISLSKKSIKEIINQPHDFLIEKNELLFILPELITQAQYLKQGTNAGCDENVKLWHYLLLKYKGRDFFLNVKELYSGEYLLYSITDKIK